MQGWIEDHSDAVYRAAWLILRDDDSARDVSQDTFVKAARAAHAFSDDQNVRAWLYRIATNTALNVVRSRGRERSAVERLDEPGADAQPDIETAAVVSGALEDLPEHLRAVVVAKYWMQLSEKEIADSVGIKPGTVKSRLHAARQLLAANPALAAEGGA